MIANPAISRGSLIPLALRLLEALHERLSRYQATREIAALSDATLADIGVERHGIEAAFDREMMRIDRLGLRR